MNLYQASRMETTSPLSRRQSIALFLWHLHWSCILQVAGLSVNIIVQNAPIIVVTVCQDWLGITLPIRMKVKQSYDDFTSCPCEGSVSYCFVHNFFMGAGSCASNIVVLQVNLCTSVHRRTY